MLTLSKGWVARNTDGRVWFYNKKPYAVENIGQWDLVIAGGGMARQLGHGLFTDLPVFNPDLPWTEHIVEVGWDETVVVKDEWNATTTRITGRKIEDVTDEPCDVVPILSADADLKDGWVAEDRNSNMFWYSQKPSSKHSFNSWLMRVPHEMLRLNDNEVIFPSSWPWDKRIVRIVGNQIVRDE